MRSLFARRPHLLGEVTPKRRITLLACFALSACNPRTEAPASPKSELPPWRVEKGPEGTEYRALPRGRYTYMFNPQGVLTRLTFDLDYDGRPEATAVVGSDGSIEEVLLDWDSDGKVNRHEWRGPKKGARPLVWGDRQNESRWGEFEGLSAAPPTRVATTPGQPAAATGAARALRVAFNVGPLLRVQLDADGDKRLDRDQYWERGRVASEAIDSDGDGVFDLRLEYTDKGVVTRPIAGSPGKK